MHIQRMKKVTFYVDKRGKLFRAQMIIQNKFKLFDYVIGAKHAFRLTDLFMTSE